MSSSETFWKKREIRPRQIRWRVSYKTKTKTSLIPLDVFVIFFSLPLSSDKRLLISSHSCRFIPFGEGRGGGRRLWDETHMPPLSCLSGSPCRTEMDEAAWTCSAVHRETLTHTHTNKHTLSLSIISLGTHPHQTRQGRLVVKQEQREDHGFS